MAPGRGGARRDVAAWLLVATTLAGAAGCGAACDTSNGGNPPTRYADGVATSTGLYESSRAGGELLPFPGGKQYQLIHHLGFAPALVTLYIAFEPNAFPVAPCAGNSCVIRCIDDELLRVKNDTCADFWLRVVAFGESSDTHGPSCTGRDGGSSGDAGAGDGDASDEGAPPMTML